MAQIITVSEEENFGPGKRKRVFTGDRRILIVNTGDAIYAVDDRCTHAGGSLFDGSCDKDVITCPLYGAEFLSSGWQGIGSPGISAFKRLSGYDRERYRCCCGR